MSDSSEYRGLATPPGDDEEPRAGPDRHAERLLAGIRALHHRMDRLEGLIGPERREAGSTARQVIPAWRRVTAGEPRWQVTIVLVAAIALQLALPERLVLFRPAWVLPVLQALLIIVLVIASPRRIDRESRLIRAVSLALVAVLSLANAWSAAALVSGLAGGGPLDRLSARTLLISGGAIWLTNIIVFALWYWEFDRGGPVARANATRQYPDFQFVQMISSQQAPPDWEPMFGDYLYLAFTNAAAFSPTDVMPLSRWAKYAMLLQSIVSIATVALVIARAVNIIGG